MSVNLDTDLLDRTRDRCESCGTEVPAGDVFCDDCE